MADYSFPKHRHLKSRTTINKLFTSGKKKLIFPILYQYSISEFEKPVVEQILCGVTVSKKKAKKAVQRNRLKRQMRETYRLRPFKELNLSDRQQIAIMAVYIGELPGDYTAMTRSMNQFKSWLEKKHGHESG